MDLDSTERGPGINPRVLRAVVLALALLLAAAGLAYTFLNRGNPPPPPEVARDPLLAAGREVYLGRCASCHGPSGRGDGPIAKGMKPPVGDLTDREWKHGDRPDRVLAVVGEGVPNTSMPGWGRVLDPHDLKAVTAYVYYLGKREIPGELRAP